MRKLAIAMLALCAIFMPATAQQKKITGKVLDGDAHPVPGASVTIKGASSGTVTDGGGSFSLNTSQGATLVISAVGYSPYELKVGAGADYSVTLTTESQTLTDVVITGVAGSTSRKNLTVSVTKVNEAQLKAVPGLSISSALTGKVAGLRTSSVGGAPGQQVDLLLRGDNVLNVSASPLILLDGIIMQGSLADINVDDVESIEVVKGAAAAALYGSRAGNGVLSVTTKRGKDGLSGKPQVIIRNEVGFQNLQHYYETSKSHFYNLASDWESVQGLYTKYAGVTYPAGYEGGYVPNTGAGAIQGTPTIKADGYMDNPYGSYRFNPGDIFKTGISYTNYVGVSNRSERNNIFLSFENNEQQGVVKYRDGYSRQNFRFNIDQQVTPWLKVSATNLFIKRSVQAPSGVFYNVARMKPDANLFAKNPDGSDYNFRIDPFNGEITNPLYALYNQKATNQSRRWMGNYTANFKFTNWANLDVTQTFEIENNRAESINPKNTYNANYVYTGGSLSQSSSETSTQNTQVTLNLTQQFGDLNIRGKLSYLYEDRHFESTSVSGSQFSYVNIENFDNLLTQNGGGSEKTNERAQNYFAILGLNYKDKYLFDGMFRYDGSSLFGPESRWNSYYRLSGAYRISKDFHIDGIDELKVRAAYGTAGIRPSFYWQYEIFEWNARGAAAPAQTGNPKLKPSNTAETEIGLNVDFLKKFTFEGTYARSVTSDQFLSVPLVPFLNFGYNRQWQNAGKVESKTLEFTLGANWVSKKDFSWNSNIVFSRVRQRITELPIPAYWLSPQSGDVNAFRVEPGEVYGAIYGHKMVRSLDQMGKQLPAGGNIADYVVNNEGYVILKGTEGTNNERPILYQENGSVWLGKIGDGNAKFNMGLANTLNYKGFSFYFLLDWKNGGDIYNSNGQRMAFNNVSKLQDMSDVPADQKKAASYWSVGMYDANFANSYWVEDGSYLKLREVAFGYTIPAKAFNNFLNGTIKGITLKAVGRNLHTFTGYSGYDPEVGTVRQPIDGIGANPIYRTVSFSLGINL
ncbi:SusC/RagA family TonB-linked outer membrane protein [Terrimonas sp. NA20]|uniref:SusC/RagA family TonB-linked outer membrane protein n=1 Tax=Terrimonas ginsenosidimutans TaxID=2908004 RepID=A0ABS9KPC6_9BACT|nr:SusC/RagA family TonB-linked outer membrane protein [Terrimonas ginsenosidimutans]MCG2614156.1 SusC/RagA family TonB-linked outer membrane protein [Terrimonas ginsenosidimutans]